MRLKDVAVRAGWLLCLGMLAVEAHARSIVFISDLHMGLGRDDAGNWYPTEDFRWPAALEGFLNHITKTSGSEVDLVIVGDFLELWQPPPGVTCEGPSADYGCTLEEATTILRTVIAAHRRELEALAEFAREGTNCLHIIPGNHDAVLVIDGLWALVADALEADRGCVHRAASGTWVSADGRVVAEHGHQIGWDPNRYPAWPKITAQLDGMTFVRRPWGEQFVQKIFNDEESQYPLIDNLSPVSAGAKYRAADRGAGATAGDLMQLVKFNLLETSVSQKIAVLGEQDHGEPPRWNIAEARQLGAALFAGALAADDPLGALLADDSNAALRDSLEQLAGDGDRLTDDAVATLCDQIAGRGVSPECPLASNRTLGSLMQKVISSRERIVTPYVKNKWEGHTDMRVFVYGHTHAFETEWPVEISSRVEVNVLNDGAFQRVIDDAKFRDRVGTKDPILLGEGMRALQLEDLPACYTFVTITEGGLNRSLWAWYMDETAAGEPIDVCDSRCADIGHGCE